MLSQASLLTIHRINAADQNPTSAAQEIGHLLKRAPGERRPSFLLPEQQDQPVGCVASDGEVSAPGRSREVISKRDGLTNCLLNSLCHAAIMAQLRRDVDSLSCRGQPPTAPDRMNAKTRGKMWQNSPPPQESTSPPARSIASHKGSADRTKSSAVAASTSSTAHTSARISRRESVGRSASESRFHGQTLCRPAASVLICRRRCAASNPAIVPKSAV